MMWDFCCYDPDDCHVKNFYFLAHGNGSDSKSTFSGTSLILSFFFLAMSIGKFKKKQFLTSLQASKQAKSCTYCNLIGCSFFFFWIYHIN